jgi:hypothetical protein
MNSNVVDVLRQEITPAVQDRDILISAQLIMSGINTLALVPEKYLRDYFAGQAMLGMIASPGRSYSDALLGELSYKIADAMLAAREKKA